MLTGLADGFGKKGSLSAKQNSPHSLGPPFPPYRRNSASLVKSIAEIRKVVKISGPVLTRDLRISIKEAFNKFLQSLQCGKICCSTYTGTG
jgi:hypothetical protein